MMATETLPALVRSASQTLASAETAAEVLVAKELAGAAYDTAKRAARFAKAKDAHDELLSKVHRAQADALEIEAQAKRRLADEYDAAQERGELAVAGVNQWSPEVAQESGDHMATAADLGISRARMAENRVLRDAEKVSPGLVHKVAEDALAEGRAPTRADAMKAARKATGRTETAQPRRGKAAVCRRVREAVTALSGLPPAEQVAKYLTESDEIILINERLAEAVDWLLELADALEKTNADDN